MYRGLLLVWLTCDKLAQVACRTPSSLSSTRPGIRHVATVPSVPPSVQSVAVVHPYPWYRQKYSLLYVAPTLPELPNGHNMTAVRTSACSCRVGVTRSYSEWSMLCKLLFQPLTYMWDTGQTLLERTELTTSFARSTLGEFDITTNCPIFRTCIK